MPRYEQLFINELDIFRTEAQSVAQFLYGYLGLNSSLNRNNRALNLINKAPLFWKTVMGSLQTAVFIALGRIFDQNSPHNIDKLLKLAQDNIYIFSKEALAKRKQNIITGTRLDNYLKKAYEPTINDFRELRKKVKENRKVYEANYRDIRRKIYAHNAITDDAEVDKLFSNTNIRELQKVIVFVNSFHEALWQLFNNGRKPVLRRVRYSVHSILRHRKPEWHNQTVQERVVIEVDDFINILGSIDTKDIKTKHKRNKRTI